MNIEPQYTVLVSIVSLILVPVIGFFLNRMIKSVDNKLDTMMTEIQKIMTDMAVMKTSHNTHDKDISKLAGAVEEQRGINLSQESRIVDHGHDIANLKNQMNVLTKLHDRLDIRVEKLEEK